ncbi:hypothetical protein BDV96DRAFT_77376 [Lophiotrema nucula]|uniref:Uncharacterized protein n=1 Tax=Lophiotrema nucula TaxID=690887 RepID=A0A6A5Z7I1_9PLEO|nr:hypothetical protein BDV96DRAFT_77376 [Lophiotrema nucula]
MPQLRPPAASKRRLMSLPEFSHVTCVKLAELCVLKILMLPIVTRCALAYQSSRTSPHNEVYLEIVHVGLCGGRTHGKCKLCSLEAAVSGGDTRRCKSKYKQDTYGQRLSSSLQAIDGHALPLTALCLGLGLGCRQKALMWLVKSRARGIKSKPGDMG